MEHEQTSDHRPHRDRHRRATRLAALRGGVITGQELVIAGYPREVIRRRVRSGQLHELGADVFAIDHRLLTPTAWLHVGLLAGGPGSCLSYWSAAWLWTIIEQPPESVHISLPKRANRAACTSVTMHRPRNLTRDDSIRHKSLWATTPMRTLWDFASVVGETELTRLLEPAVARLGVSPEAVVIAARAAGRRPGSARLARAALEIVGIPTIRSGLERRFRSSWQDAGFEPYESNAMIGKWEVDGLWIKERLALELDVYRWHGARTNYKRDRRKAFALQRLGFEVVRVDGEEYDADNYGTVMGVKEVVDRRRREVAR
jgi:very-short-patch-repair endonuclease